MPIGVQEGQLLINGWRAVEVTPTSISWARNGRSMGWQREGTEPQGQSKKADATKGAKEPDEKPKGKQLPRGASREALQRSGTGNLSPSKGGAPATPPPKPEPLQPQPSGKQQGQQQQQQQQAKPAPRGDVKEAREVAHPLQPLNGVWQNSEGLMCTVWDGRCTFVARGSFGIEVTDGVPSLNGWRGVKWNNQVVRWEKGAQKTEWNRIKKLDEVEALTGLWKDSAGSVYLIFGGKCTSPGREGEAALELREGQVLLNGWAAGAITARQLCWHRGGESAEWSRVEEASEITFLDGLWKNSDGLTCRVEGTKCTFGGKEMFTPRGKDVAALTLQDGFIVLNGWKAQRMGCSDVMWAKGSKSMAWRRLEDPAGKAPPALPPMERWGALEKEASSEPDSEPLSRDLDGSADTLSRTTDALADALRSEPRVAHWVHCMEAGQLETKLRSMLAEGSSWPTLSSKRSHLKACFSEVVDVLADSLRGPLVVPLGEDVLGSALHSLLVGAATEDERITRFRDRVKALAAGAGKGEKKDAASSDAVAAALRSV